MSTENETNSEVTENQPTPKTDKPKKTDKTKVAAKKVAAKAKPVAKKAKANGKDKKPAVKAAPKAPVQKDQFGFRRGSKKSAAAALYASKRGATLNEVKEHTGSSQLNLLTELKNQKYKVTTTKEKGTGRKQVTRYKIVLPEKTAKPDKAVKSEKSAKPEKVVKKNGPDKTEQAAT